MSYFRKEKEEVRPCVCCKTNHKIYDRNKWLCKDCASNKKKEKFNRATLENDENDLQVVMERIWERRTHYCFHCGTYLGSTMKPIYFSHILSRGAHPKLRCDEDNIVLACRECHYIYDFGDRSRLKYQISRDHLEELLKKERDELR